MRWFSVFSDAWNSLTGSDGLDAATPTIVNIDGTPMLNESVDIHGNPFGVTSIESPAAPGQSWDWGSSDGGGSGSGGFSDWP